MQKRQLRNTTNPLYSACAVKSSFRTL